MRPREEEGVTSPEVIRVATGGLKIKKGLWQELSWRLSPNVFAGRVVGIWGRRGSIAIFMVWHYTACSPPFLLKSVEFLSQPARLQTTTLRYNRRLGRRDEKRRSLIFFSSRALVRPRAWVSRASNFGPFAMTGVVVIGSWQRKIRDCTQTSSKFSVEWSGGHSGCNELRKYNRVLQLSKIVSMRLKKQKSDNTYYREEITRRHF